MKKLYVLDALNFLFRSYYAIGPMTNPKGESTGALYGFIRSVFKLIKEEEPDYLVAVFDGPESTKSRKELYSDYKIHRTGMPEDLYPQLERALEFCKLAGIPYLSVPGVEADDVMGSLTKQNETRGIKTLLCSSDKDLCQLVTDKTHLLNIHKEGLIMDRKGVKEKLAVYPEQVVDLLAMMGDPSDNIPGLPGIGPKTAASLLNQYNTLDEIYDHIDELKGKKRQTLIENRDAALLSRKLATIQTDVRVPTDDDFFHLKSPNLEKVKAFYQEMHFMTLLKEMQLPEKKSRRLDIDSTVYTLINDEAALTSLLDALEEAPILCIDTETTGIDPMQARLVGLGISDEVARAWYIPFNGKIPKGRITALLKPFLAHPKRAFFGHNIKYDLHILENTGIPVGRVDFDTMIASYLIAPHHPRHNLDHLALHHFEKVKTPLSDLIGKGKKQLSMEEVPLEKAASYCCEDVDYTFRLRRLFELKMETEHLEKLFKEIELPLIPALFRMEQVGICLDKSQIEKMRGAIESTCATLSSAIYEMAGQSFNLNSPKQLGVILFEHLGIRPVKKTATGFSTSAPVLESLRESHPIVEKILEYRSVEKLRSTYINALPLQIHPKTGRIHCTFNQSVTATGRLSCTDPNLQNIPIRTKEGKAIRSAFKPQESSWSFLAADYSQIELRLLAHLSGDPTLIQAFNDGEDIHAFTASLVYKIPLREVTKAMRYSAKAVNFGILYGQSAFGLSKEIGTSTSEAKTFIDTYFDRYKTLRDYLEMSKETARKQGYSTTLMGRKRPIPEITSKNSLIRQAAERLAINTPLQGSAADLIKIAMIAIDNALQGDRARMLLQIHDELLFEVPDGQIDALTRIVRPLMEGVAPLKVPLVVDILVGKNWAQC